MITRIRFASIALHIHTHTHGLKNNHHAEISSTHWLRKPFGISEFSRSPAALQSTGPRLQAPRSSAAAPKHNPRSQVGVSLLANLESAAFARHDADYTAIAHRFIRGIKFACLTKAWIMAQVCSVSLGLFVCYQIGSSTDSSPTTQLDPS